MRKNAPRESVETCRRRGLQERSCRVRPVFGGKFGFSVTGRGEGQNRGRTPVGSPASCPGPHCHSRASGNPPPGIRTLSRLRDSCFRRNDRVVALIRTEASQGGCLPGGAARADACHPIPAAPVMHPLPSALLHPAASEGYNDSRFAPIRRGVAQFGQSACLGRKRSLVQVQSPRVSDPEGEQCAPLGSIDQRHDDSRLAAEDLSLAQEEPPADQGGGHRIQLVAGHGLGQPFHAQVFETLP